MQKSPTLELGFELQIYCGALLLAHFDCFRTFDSAYLTFDQLTNNEGVSRTLLLWGSVAKKVRNGG